MYKPLLFVTVLILSAAITYAANTTTSPNMGMPIPVVGTDPGPDWANNINASLSIIDSHNHTPGQGVPVPVNGLNINQNLPFNGYSATQLQTTTYNSQATTLPSTTQGAVYDVAGNLYFNNSAGTAVQITSGNSIVGTAGSISGLPSGTAGVSYSGGTYTFVSATNTPATLAVGPVAIGDATASSPTVTLAPASGIAASYDINFPANLPSASNYVTLDNSGNLSYNTSGNTGTGAVVLASSPTITTPTISGTVSNLTLSNPAITGGTFTSMSSGNVSALTVGSAFFSSWSSGAGQPTSVDITGSGGSGGNVPFGCSVTNTSGGTASCSTNQIALGGGGICSSGTLTESYPAPSSGTPTRWGIACSGSASSTFVICCNY